MLWMSDSELDAIRLAVADLLPATVVISRLAESVDAYGGVSKSYSAVGTVAGRVDNLPSKVVVAGLKESTYIKMQLTVAWNADLRADDRVTVDGVIYELVGVQTDQTDKAVKRGIVARRGS